MRGWIHNPLEYLIPPQSPETPLGATFSPEVREWAKLLAKHENCLPDGTWDTGSYSYGRYCYKVSSWREDASSTRFYENAEMIELDNFRGDPHEQDRVLAWVINNKPSRHLVMRWKTTIITKHVGLPPK